MSITVKLSDYERALNQLNNIPAKQARIFEAALASLKQQRDEARAQVRQLRARLVECRPWVGVCPIVPAKIAEMCTVRDLADDTLAEISK